MKKLLEDKKSFVECLFKCFYVVIGITATVISFTMPNLTGKGEVRSPFMFYTNWSVWFVLITACLSFAVSIFWLCEKKNISNQIIECLRFASLIMIIATFIISAFVLPDKIWKAGYWTVPSIFKHFLLPILTVIDYALYTRRGSLKLYFPFTALIVPLIYWNIIIARFLIKRGSLGGRIPEESWPFYYPYGFTNIDNGKSLGFLIGLLSGILVGLVAIGYALYFLKKERQDAVNHFE